MKNNFLLQGLQGIAIMIIIALFLSLILILLSYLLSTKNWTSEKLSPYECGFEPFNTESIFENEIGRFDIKYYLVSLLFILFDLEILFVFPIVTLESHILKETGFFIFILFIVILTIGFIYEYSKKALEQV